MEMIVSRVKWSRKHWDIENCVESVEKTPDQDMTKLELSFVRLKGCDKDFPASLGKDVLLLTLQFIHETSRFDQKYFYLSYKP